MKKVQLPTLLRGMEGILLSGIILTLAALVLHRPIGVLFAEATSQPEVEISATSTALSTNETSTVSVVIKNESAQNTIDSLLFHAEFTDEKNPTSFRITAHADGLSELVRSVSLSVPSEHYLDYVEGSSSVSFGKDESTRHTVTVPDVNGVSAFAFSKGYTLNNIESGADAWVVVTFSVKAVSTKPTVFHSSIEFFKYVANGSQSLNDKRTETSVGANEEATVQLFLHNAVLESTAHNVKVQDEDVDANKTLTARVFSSEEGDKTASARINTSVTGDLELVSGSGVIRDVEGNVVKTLSDSELKDLFSGGLLLNGDGVFKGCWEYMRSIEYKVRLKKTGTTDEEHPKLSIDKKVVFNGNRYDSVDRGVNTYDAGESVRYEVVVKNIGDAIARDVEMEDTLPPYLDFISSSPSGSYDRSSRILTVDLGDLDPNEEVTITVDAEIKDILPQGDRTLDNLAEACGDNVTCVHDNALIWIDGPDITTVEERVIRETVRREQVVQNVTRLPETGVSNLVLTAWYRLKEVLR